MPSSGVAKGRDKRQEVHNRKKTTKEFLNRESGILEPSQDNKIIDTKFEEKVDKEKSLSPDFSKDSCISSGSGMESDIEDNSLGSTGEKSEKLITAVDSQNNENSLPNTVQVLETPQGCKCYIIGTVHFSLESQEDVSKVIQAVKPEVVVVELCAERIHVLELDEETILKEAKNLDYNKIVNTIKQDGFYKGIIYLLLLDLSARITKILGLAPGGEFRRALTEAKKLYPKCLVVLGDRSIKVTLGRAVSALSWWQTIRMAWHLLTLRDIVPEDLEACKSRDALDEMLNELTKEYPDLVQVFVKERDIYLTHSLQTACEYRRRDGERVKNVVGVVGMGHVPGIIENWGKISHEQVIPILRVPPPTLTTKVLKASVKISLIVGVCYLGYKLVPISASAYRLVKSSVTGLLENGRIT